MKYLFLTKTYYHLDKCLEDKKNFVYKKSYNYISLILNNFFIGIRFLNFYLYLKKNLYFVYNTERIQSYC